MSSGRDKNESIREEFLSEVQELIEGMSRDLLMLDHAQKQGSSDPELLNDLFRGVHTLKGLAGMFGFSALGELAHCLEDLLEDLRLGRVEVTQRTLDLLFEGVDSFQRLLAEAKNPEDKADVNIAGFATALREGVTAKATVANILEAYDLDPGVLAVLTEYEEHRLRTNLEAGTALYRMRVLFPLDSIDTELEGLKTRTKQVAEIISYLPSAGDAPDDQIDIEILLASAEPADRLSDVLALPGVALERVERKGSASEPARSQADVLSVVPPASVPMAATTPRVREDAIALETVTLRSVTNSVRVDIRKLDHLMNVVGELGIVRSGVARIQERLRGHHDLRELARELHRIHRSFERHLNEVQAGILDVRMVPLGNIFDKVARIVRQVARDSDKDVRLLVSGGETEVDKLIAEELADPMMHIVRNAVDHGIETPAARLAQGKPEGGTLTIRAQQKGNHVVIEVQDDGKGIDPEHLLATAVRKGMMSAGSAAELTREEMFNIIFMPGFSTTDQVTDLSGRGVGMDVVKTNINRLGGVIDVRSEVGAGSTFTMTLPITLAIISALIVRVREQRFAIPLATVQEALRLEPGALRTVEGREMLTLRRATLPVCRLDEVFDLENHEPRADKQFVVVVVLGQRRLGFIVDELYGQQDTVIKALGPSLRNLRGIAGATDLGDQRLVLVLDAPVLLEEVLLGSEAHAVLGASA